jgi:cobalt-zinc-cadmium efflux system membrane fusion protein
MDNLKRQSVVALWILASCGSGAEHSPATEVAPERGVVRIAANDPQRGFIKIEPVEESAAAGGLSLTGRVAFDEDHTQRLASPIDGRVTKLFVEPGDSVKAGQRLLELSSPDVGRLQAEAQKAFQDLAVAQKSLDRVHKLRVDGAVSDKDLIQVEADYSKAKSDVARSGAQLKSLGISPSDPVVDAALHAQITGTVVARSVLVGQEVRGDSADALVTITNLDTVWVLADVYEQDLGLIHKGDSVTLRTLAYPDEIFEGTVGYVGDVVDAQSRTVKIRCIFPNREHRLKPEMFVKVDVRNVAGKKVVVIPSTAVINHGEVSRTIVALEGNTFQARNVDVGPEHDGKVRLLGGLRVGERIVTDGALFLENELRD